MIDDRIDPGASYSAVQRAQQDLWRGSTTGVSGVVLQSGMQVAEDQDPKGAPGRAPRLSEDHETRMSRTLT